jgi:hypothetical protein
MGIVQHDGMPVVGQMNVEFDTLGTDSGGSAKGAQGVFGVFGEMASMGENLQ